MTFGQRLKIFAKQRFKTQKALGEYLRMSDSQLSDYIRDRYPPGGPLLEKLARAGANINWLLTGEEVMVLPDRSAGFGGAHDGAHEPPPSRLGELEMLIARAATLVAELQREELG